MVHRIALALALYSAALLGTSAKAFAEKDKIEGFWYNAEKTAKLQIYKATDGKFWGKLVWLKEPNKNGKPRVDEHNAKEQLRTRPMLNLSILSNFTKKNDDTYDGGEIYDPKNGKTYSSIITYRNDKELGLRGYIGISLIGRTTILTRAE